MPRFPVQSTARTQKYHVVNVLPNATISVVDSAGNTATLYTTKTGSTTLLNPTTADADGNFSFWLENGDYYEITITSGSDTKTVTAIGDISVHGAKTVAPTVNDDSTAGYVVSSIWQMTSGIMYDCIDASTGAAVWVQRPFEVASYAAMAALSNVVAGQRVTVKSGYNGQAEEFDLVAAGTYASPDGVLVRNLTGSSVQAVSQRTEYASFAEFIADPRTHTAGTTHTIPSIGATYLAVVSGGNLGQANAGGQLYDVIPSNGVYPFLAWAGDLSPTDNATSWASAALLLPTGGIEIRLPQGTLNFASVCNFDVPQDTVINAYGSNFVATHDGVLFDMNPNFNPATNGGSGTNTKRNVAWFGGTFENTNVSKTASEAIRAYGMRNFRIQYAKFAPADWASAYGFYKAIVIDAKDTYLIRSNQFFNNTINIHVPGLCTTASDCPLDIYIEGNEFSGSVTNNILIEDKVIGLHIIRNSFNGAGSAGSILVKDNSISFSESIKIKDNHFEQFDSNGAIVFASPNNNGCYAVDISGNDIIGSTAGWHGIILDRTRAIIDSYFRDGGGGSTEVGISVDVNSRIQINTGSSISYASTNFLSVATPISVATGARSAIESIPSSDNYSAPNPLAGFSATTFSTTAETTITMSSEMANWANWPLPPKAYMVGLRVQDSGSAASTNCWFAVRNGAAAGSDALELRVDLAGVTNSSFRGANGIVAADDSGNISYACVATGTNTMTVTMVVTGVFW